MINTRSKNPICFISIYYNLELEKSFIYFSRALSIYSYNFTDKNSRLFSQAIADNNYKLLDPIYNEKSVKLTWVNLDIK